MKIKIALFAILMLTVQTVLAQDILVKKDGSILNVYNLEESNSSYFYTLELSADAATQKISKDDVFTIRKKDGGTVLPVPAQQTATKKAVPTHEPVTAKATTAITTDKKGNRMFSAATPDGHSLDYAILSDADYTVEVVKGKYKEHEYVIPEYVKLGDDTYTVTQLGKKAFYMENIRKMQFPLTLKRIGENAFRGCTKLEGSILLPEGLETIDDFAFFTAGMLNTFSEIYLPSSVKKLGAGAFLNCGHDTSYRGFCQAYFSNMPDYITEGNCKGFGIDEEAVRAYNQKKK